MLAHQKIPSKRGEHRPFGKVERSEIDTGIILPLSFHAILMRSLERGISHSRSLHEICKHASAASTKESKTGLWSGLALRASLCITDAAWAGSCVEKMIAGIETCLAGESGSSEGACIAAKWWMSSVACIGVRVED